MLCDRIVVVKEVSGTVKLAVRSGFGQPCGGPQGKIARIAHGDEEAEVLKEFSLKSSDVKRMAEGQFFMPGGSATSELHPVQPCHLLSSPAN